MAYEPKTWECGEIITADDLNHIEQGIKATEDILPSVDSEDNGKVLTVVNGEWDKAEPSGGGGGAVTVVPFFSDGYESGFLKGNDITAYPREFYTYDELLALYENGTVLSFFAYGGGFSRLTARVDFVAGNPSFGVLDSLKVELLQFYVYSNSLSATKSEVEFSSNDNINVRTTSYPE